VLAGVFADGAHGLLWGAAYSSLLAAACVYDLRARRIPNSLVVVLATLGVIFTIGRSPGLTGASTAAGGLLVGFGLWIVPFALRMLGAGDVKLFAAAGTWIGALAALHAAFYAALAGGLMALMWWLACRRRTDASVSRPTLPYGIPMALGLAVVAWLGAP
jgi:prepilin peptidase CpaA